MGLVSELRRRNVFRMAVLYVVAAWLIMQVAEVIIGLANLPEWIGPTILGLLAVGFPIALVFSWFYELTPEGISLETDVAAAETITHVTGRRIDFIVISLLCAGLILFAYDKWWIAPPPEKSIAVLPFVNMSDDPGNEYFSDGISEELLNLLARIPQLTVISRSSSFSFKGKEIDTPAIAEQLNVAHVLEGSVRKEGNRVRITAQLIEARSDSHLWSETYDRELENIFAVQDEISIAIVGALKKRLGLEIEAIPQVVATANTEAYEAYLRGRYLMAQYTSDSVAGAVHQFEKAIALDPNYALAHAEVAIATTSLERGSKGHLTSAEVIAKAAPHARKAITLDSRLAEAHVATGVVRFMQGKVDEALSSYENAIAINPNHAAAYNFVGGTSMGRGDYEKGLAMIEVAARLDPLSIAAWNHVVTLIWQDRLEEAGREVAKLESWNPAIATTARARLTSRGGKWADLVMGDLDHLRFDPRGPRQRLRLGLLFAAIGLQEEAMAISEYPTPWALVWLGRIEEAVAAAEEHVHEGSRFNRRDLGRVLAAAGNYSRARPILEEAWQRGDGRVTMMGLFKTNDAAALIAARRAADDAAGADELVTAIHEDVRRSREAGITKGGLFGASVDFAQGLANHLNGDNETGLALVAKAAEDGHFVPLNVAYLQSLYDAPGFAHIRAVQEARQDRERWRFLAIVCAENPYAAVWQPAEGTCEQFAAMVETDSMQ